MRDELRTLLETIPGEVEMIDGMDDDEAGRVAGHNAYRESVVFLIEQLIEARK